MTSATQSSVLTAALKALTLGKRLSLDYHGEPRIVEVHAVGVSNKNKPCLRVYQVIGGSVFSEESGWKMLSIADCDNPQLLDVDSQAPREGYKVGDKGMSKILSEIPHEPAANNAQGS